MGEGLALQADFLKKGCEVHLAQSKPKNNKNPMKINNWYETLLVKQLKKSYKRLIFIIDGHGLKNMGADIQCKSFLKLVKILEKKAEKMFIHIATCYSGSVVNKWMKEFSKKVKIFTTSSCENNKSSFDPEYFNHTNVLQFFTGYYLRGTDEKFKKEIFKNLHCGSTLSDITKLLSKPCNDDKSCLKMHIHKGKHTKMVNWKLLPKNLTVADNENYFNKKNTPFDDDLCPPTIIAYDKKMRICFEEKVEIKAEVNTLDPINAWKLRTTDVKFETKNGNFIYTIQEKLKKKNIPSYSSILKINDKKCDIVNGGCNSGLGISCLRNTESLTVGYHENKNKIWIIEEGDFNKNENIGMFTLVALLASIILICILHQCYQIHKIQKRNLKNETKHTQK